MHQNRKILEKRIERTLAERILPAQTTLISNAKVYSWNVPDAEDGGPGEPLSFAEAMDKAEFSEVELGSKWGRFWGTTWLKVEVDVPADDRDKELIVDLGWFDHSPGFQSEALAYTPEGKVIKALNPKNHWLPLPKGHTGSLTIYIEAASNPIVLDVRPFLPTTLGDRLTADSNPFYELRNISLVETHDEVRKLVTELEIIHHLASSLGDTDRAWQLLLAGHDAIDVLNFDDIPGTAALAREQLADVMSRKNSATTHTVHAVGHAHIDSAWLWPLRETKRKVARTIANVVQQIEDGSPLIFAFPAAQHAVWLKEDQPELAERAKKLVEEGKIVPVGGMWVEADGVQPGSEAMARQFVEGRLGFEEVFGVRCGEVWLPDSFGYSAALPQIFKLAGMENFLTQKISWNQVDKFPHHTFNWEGIDGTRIFSHFPPADTYNGELTANELVYSVNNFKEKGRAGRSILPFGHGDGGGGPVREMIDRGVAQADLEGSPKVVFSNPKDFWSKAKEEYTELPVWVGELYLELHRGTLTSQVAVKQGNRLAEHALRKADLWTTYAHIKGVMEHPTKQLRELWRKALLCQFHDILPGSSIAWVYQDVEKIYDQITTECEELTRKAISALAGEGSTTLVENAASFDNQGVAPFAIAQPVELEESGVKAQDNGDTIILSNENLEVTFTNGLVTSMVVDGREVVVSEDPLGQLHLHQDFPNEWDAWDIDLFYKASKRVLDVKNVTLEDGDSASPTVVVEYEFDNSKATLYFSLNSQSKGLHLRANVDWHEREKLLKLSLPVAVHTDHANYEMQFGHVTRSTHTNTSWDHWRFEVGAHRWLQLGEPDFGVSIATNGITGWDISRNPNPKGGTYSEVRGSLVRGPRYPDPNTDEGEHTFKLEIVPNSTVVGAIESAQKLNLPPLTFEGEHPVEALVSMDGEAIIESVHLAHDGSNDVLVRIYEPTGSRVKATFETIANCSEIKVTDLYGEEYESQDAIISSDSNKAELQFNPFEIVTLRLYNPTF